MFDKIRIVSIPILSESPLSLEAKKACSTRFAIKIVTHANKSFDGERDSEDPTMSRAKLKNSRAV